MQRPHNLYKAIKFLEKQKPNSLPFEYSIENCFWNVGIFILKTSLLESLFKHNSHIMHSFLKNSDYRKNPIILSNDIYNFFYHSSFDSIIMNRLEDFYMISANFGWLDAGSFKNIFLCFIKNIYGSSK